MAEIMDLMQGAIDMHCHIIPDLSLSHPMHWTNESIIENAKSFGMAGLVFKTHGMPRTSLAREINNATEDFEIIPSITLNLQCGGCHVWAAEMAYVLGAKVVWFPTITARSWYYANRAAFDGFIVGYIPSMKSLKESDFVYVLDENGELIDEAKDIIAFCKEKDLVLGTGHLSAKESMAIGKFAKEIGYFNVMLTHPLDHGTHNTFEQIKAFAEMGHSVEMLSLTIDPSMPDEVTIADYVRVIRECGPEHCYIGTDFFFDFQPAPGSALYQLLVYLHSAGATYDELKTMMQTPHRLLGI